VLISFSRHLECIRHAKTSFLVRFYECETTQFEFHCVCFLVLKFLNAVRILENSLKRLGDEIWSLKMHKALLQRKF